MMDEALGVAQAGEIIRAASGRGSVAYRELTNTRLEALYEMAYLRVFVLWEVFLEESFIRVMSGYATTRRGFQLVNPPYLRLEDARQTLFGGQKYLSWSNAGAVCKILAKHVTSGLHESVLRSNQSRLDWYTAVRNRIAHRSRWSAQRFDAATLALAGRTYPGAQPGKFLRSWHVQTGQRWLHPVALELKGLASQISE
jgi:hypothetical protein